MSEISNKLDEITSEIDKLSKDMVKIPNGGADGFVLAKKGDEFEWKFIPVQSWRLRSGCVELGDIYIQGGSQNDINYNRNEFNFPGPRRKYKEKYLYDGSSIRICPNFTIENSYEYSSQFIKKYIVSGSSDVPLTAEDISSYNPFDVDYVEFVIDFDGSTAKIVEGDNVLLMNEIVSGKRNICIMRWDSDLRNSDAHPNKIAMVWSVAAYDAR